MEIYTFFIPVLLVWACLNMYFGSINKQRLLQIDQNIPGFG